MIRRIIKLNVFIVLLVLAPLLMLNLTTIFNNSTPKAYAASLTTLSDTLSTMKESTLADHTIQFITPTGIVSTSQNITLTFATGFNLGTTNVNNYDLAVSASTSCASFTDRTISGTSGGADTWGVNLSGQVITFYGPTSGTIGTSGVPAGRCVSIEIGSNATYGASGTTQITNQTAAQNTSDPKITISVAATDTGSIATEIVTAANSQVGVSATVDPTLAFTMTPTTLTFGTLSTSAIRYADNNTGSASIPAQAATPLLTASTNGASGVLISIYDVGNGTGGLYSSVVGDLIPASSVNGLVGGNKKFGVTGLSGSSLTLTPGFSGTSTGGTGTISNVAQSFASSAGPVASGNAAMILVASIDATTKAGAYTDTVTVVCTGRY